MNLQQPNTFGGLSLVLDRVAERRDEWDWVLTQTQAADACYLLLDDTGRAFAQARSDTLRWLDNAERQRWLADHPPTLLGIAGERPHFLITVAEDRLADQLEHALAAQRVGLREAGLRLSAHEAGLFAYAKGLAHWQREMRYCSWCGAALALVASGHRAKCTAADCGRLHFPRTDAAIIVIVEHAGACLLGRQASWPEGRYSTLAGFVEPGESLEDAVRREVAEESGVQVDQVRYHSSQPWPMPASLMVGFTATARGRDIHLRDGELEDARWFTPEQIVAGLADGSFGTPTRLSVSYRLLAHWLQLRAGLSLDQLTGASTG